MVKVEILSDKHAEFYFDQYRRTLSGLPSITFDEYFHLKNREKFQGSCSRKGNEMQSKIDDMNWLNSIKNNELVSRVALPVYRRNGEPWVAVFCISSTGVLSLRIGDASFAYSDYSCMGLKDVAMKEACSFIENPYEVVLCFAFYKSVDHPHLKEFINDLRRYYDEKPINDSGPRISVQNKKLHPDCTLTWSSSWDALHERWIWSCDQFDTVNQFNPIIAEEHGKFKQIIFDRNCYDGNPGKAKASFARLLGHDDIGEAALNFEILMRGKAILNKIALGRINDCDCNDNSLDNLMDVHTCNNCVPYVDFLVYSRNSEIFEGLDKYGD